MRSCFAAAFPLFAGAMYHRLGSVGATALLAGLMTLMVPLPYVFDWVLLFDDCLILFYLDADLFFIDMARVYEEIPNLPRRNDSRNVA